MEKLKKLWKYLTSKEMILYILFGVLTTALNLGIYYVLTELAHSNKALAFFVAWVAGMLFAFLTNKKFVFESRARTGRALLYEFGTFAAGRLGTFAIGEVLIICFVQMLGQNNMLWKVITNLIEILGNWVVSKFITFKKKAD